MATLAPKPTKPTIGMVRGKGTQTSDSIPAMVSKDESIFNAPATKKLAELIKKEYGMTIDEFNELYAPKGAETKVVGGVLHASGGAMNMDLLNPKKPTPIAPTISEAPAINPALLERLAASKAAGGHLLTAEQAQSQAMAKIPTGQGVGVRAMPTVSNPVSSLINVAKSPASLQVARKAIGVASKFAAEKSPLVGLAVESVGAAQDINANPQMTTLDKVARYGEAAGNSFGLPLPEMANSTVNMITGGDNETPTQKIARQNGEKTNWQYATGAMSEADANELATGKAASSLIPKTVAPIASIAPPTTVTAPDTTAKVGVAPTVMNTQQSVLPQSKAPSSWAISEFMPELSKTSGNMSPVGKAPDTNTTYTASPVVEGQPTASVSFKQGTATMAKNTGVSPRADANGDGNLSGSEQYLRDNQDTQGGNYVSPTYMANQRNSAVQMDSYAGQNMARDKGYQSNNDAEGNIRAALGVPRVNGANTSDSVMTVDNGRGGTGTISGSGAGMDRLGTPEAQARISKELATNADPAFQTRMAEQTKIVDDRIAKRQANEAVINNAAQRNALIAQSQQSGNIGDKARRDSAKEQLAALDANARNDQDNKYKMASLGQNASQFEQQQQAAMATAKNLATKDERDYQLKKAESDKPMDFFTPQFEKDGVTPVVDEVTGVQKQVRETMRPSEREARQQSANNQKLTSALSQLSKVVNDPSASKEDKAAAAQFIATHGKGQ